MARIANCQYCFYLQYDIRSGIFIVISTILVYVGAIGISKVKSIIGQKIILIIVIIFNILILICLKYVSFLQELFSYLTFRREPSGMIVPLGISFYTLALIGYLIDVYREKMRPETNFSVFLICLISSTYFTRTDCKISGFPATVRWQKKVILSTTDHGASTYFMGLYQKNGDC